MADKQQARIVELQRQVKVAKNALELIKNGARNHEQLACEALDFMWPSDRKQPLQYIFGHERRPS